MEEKLKIQNIVNQVKYYFKAYGFKKTIIKIFSKLHTLKNMQSDREKYQTWILNNENIDINNMRLYNEYNYGSYLLFRGIPVFIDSRADLYAPEFNKDPNDDEDNGRDIFSDALNIAGIAYNYKDAFEKYGVTHVISYADSKLVMLLNDDSNYKKLYDDDRFTIFEKIK